MKSIAVITARGGSKRIPRKNVKAFCGKPILCYSIEAALKSGCFETVMVSTDDEEIAEIAKEAGAEVPFLRSEKTSGDFATTADVLNEVIEEYEKRSVKFDALCCIYPTAPFVTAEKLHVAMDTFEKEGADTVMPVVAYSFPPQRSLRIQNGYLTPQYPECMQMRSQDLEKIYHDVGQFYIVKVESFVKSGKIIGDNACPIIVSDLEVQDIDTFEDWAIAEMKYKLMMENR